MMLKPVGVYAASDAELIESLGGTDTMSPSSNIRLFKEKLSPKWEDYKNGGQLSMRLKREVTPQVWANLTAAVLNGHIPHMEHIAGIVLSIRLNSNAAHIWVREATELSKNQAILHYCQKVLGVHAVFVPFQVMKSRNHRIRANPDKEKMGSDGRSALAPSVAATKQSNGPVNSISDVVPGAAPSTAAPGATTPAAAGPATDGAGAGRVGQARSGEEWVAARKKAADCAALSASPPASSPSCLPPETAVDRGIMPFVVLAIAIASALIATCSAASSWF